MGEVENETRTRGEQGEDEQSAYPAQAQPAHPIPYHPLDPCQEALRKTPSHKQNTQRHPTSEYHNWSPPRGGYLSSSFIKQAFGFALSCASHPL